MKKLWKHILKEFNSNTTVNGIKLHESSKIYEDYLHAIWSEGKGLLIVPEDVDSFDGKNIILISKFGSEIKGDSMNRSQLRKDIEMAINRNCAENGSDTPDFILAEYLTDCLEAFDKTVKARSRWYNHHCRIGSCNHQDTKEDKALSVEFRDKPTEGN